MAITGAISAEREKKKGGYRFAGKKEWNKHHAPKDAAFSSLFSLFSISLFLSVLAW